MLELVIALFYARYRLVFIAEVCTVESTLNTGQFISWRVLWIVGLYCIYTLNKQDTSGCQSRLFFILALLCLHFSFWNFCSLIDASLVFSYTSFSTIMSLCFHECHMPKWKWMKQMQMPYKLVRCSSGCRWCKVADVQRAMCLWLIYSLLLIMVYFNIQL